MGRKQNKCISKTEQMELPNRTNGTPKQNKWISKTEQIELPKQNKWITKTEQIELQFPHPPLYL